MNVIRLLGSRLNGSSNAAVGSRRVLPNSIRTFRVDAPDTEARVESSSDEKGTASCLSEGQASSRSLPRTAGVDDGTGICSSPPSAQCPVRSTKPKEGERLKVLSVAPGVDEFIGNVATLLVRWPHGSLPKQPRTWRDVVDNPRFQHLFPRRLTPVMHEALRALQTLMSSEKSTSSSSSSSGSSESGASGNLEQGLVDSSWQAGNQAAHQAAIGDLLAQLQALQRQLQDNMPDDGTYNTIVAVAAFDESGSDSTYDNTSQDVSCSASENVEGKEVDGRGQDTPGYASRYIISAAGTRGRRLRRPEGARRVQSPAPPWDDTQPFQTHAGTVYHFWRLCPYG